MDSFIKKERPEWLTDELISILKKDLEMCSNPYTKEDILNLSLDGLIEMERYNAYNAKDILSTYGLM